MVTGVETAGLVLAVLPLLIAALDGYKQGLRPIKTFAWKWKFELESLIRCLKEQRWFFRTSIQVLLLAAAAGEDLTLGSDPAALLNEEDIRHKVQTYLEDADTLEFFEGVLDVYRSSLEAVIEKLGHIRRPSQNHNDIAAVLAANPSTDGSFSFSQRFDFTMRHRDMRRLVNSMDVCNDKLRKFIDRIEGINQTKRKDLTKADSAKQLAASLFKVRHHAVALHAAVEMRLSSDCHSSHESLLFLDCRSALPPVIDGTPPQLQFHSILAIDESHGVQQKVGHELLVTVVDTVVSSIPPMREVQDLCIRLNQSRPPGYALGMDLTKENKLFCCDIGFLPGQFGFLGFPESVTLEDVLNSGQRLTPRQKTRLAVDIASSLLQLQTTPWLRKSWTSRVIRFLRRAQPSNLSSTAECDKPFISQVFPSTKPHHSDELSKTDLLELGILLMEVWNLQTFEGWAAANSIELKPGYYARMTPAIQWLEAEVDSLTPSYYDAVSVCVRFSFEGVQHSWEHPAFRRSVCEKVLGALQENCRAWIRP